MKVSPQGEPTDFYQQYNFFPPHAFATVGQTLKLMLIENKHQLLQICPVCSTSCSYR